MKHRFFILAAMILVLFCFVLGDTEKKPFSVDDAINMVSVSNPQISPDGKWILFTKSELKWTLDGKSIIFNGGTRTKGNIFRLDISSGTVKQLTEKEKDR